MKSKYYRLALINGIMALIFAALTLIGYNIAARNPEWVSSSFIPFSRKCIYGLSLINGWMPFSLAEVLVYIGIIGVITYVVASIVRYVKHRKAREQRGGLIYMFSNLVVTVCFLAFFYECVWAFAYHALPLSDELGIPVKKYSVDELKYTAEIILSEVNADANAVRRNSNGVSEYAEFSVLSDRAVDSWKALSKKESFFDGFHPVAVKPVMASEAMSWSDITGIFLAFTGEANINVSAPDSSQPFTMTHELAHAAGVCPENEANFAAYLACRASEYPEFRYSGSLAAFVYCYNALYKEDKEAAWELWGRLDSLAVQDMAYRSEYWSRYEGKINKVATAMNNTYLKVMAQQDGVKSYGMVVDLLIAYHSKNAESK